MLVLYFHESLFYLTNVSLILIYSIRLKAPETSNCVCSLGIRNPLTEPAVKKSSFHTTATYRLYIDSKGQVSYQLSLHMHSGRDPILIFTILAVWDIHYSLYLDILSQLNFFGHNHHSIFCVCVCVYRNRSK